GDAAGRKNVRLDVGRIRLAGQLLDYTTENTVAEVGVGPVCAGRAGKRHVRNGLGDEPGLIPAIVVHHRISIIGGPAAGSVSQEIVDSNIGNVLLVGRAAVLDAQNGGGTKDLVREIQLALFEQRENCDRGDGLGDRGDAKEAI